MVEKQTVGRNVVYGLGVVIIIVALVAGLFAFGFISKINLTTSSNSNSNSNSNTKGAGTMTIFTLFTSDDGYGTVDLTGEVHNEKNVYAYNSQLHVVGIYPNGFKALDTYVSIGNQGVITGNMYINFDTGRLSYSHQANAGTPIWTVTAVCTNSP